jgi:hypothetical protein
MKRFNPYMMPVMDEQTLRSDTFGRPYTVLMGAQEGVLARAKVVVCPFPWKKISQNSSSGTCHLCDDLCIAVNMKHPFL